MAARLILFLLALALGACTHPKPQPEATNPVRPPVAPPSAPLVNEVTKPLSGAETSNAVLADQNRRLRAEAADARTAASRALDEVTRLRTVGQATKSELDELWLTLNEVKQRNMFMEVELQAAEHNLTKQATDLKEAREAQAKALAAANAKDAEAAELRRITSTLENQKGEALARAAILEKESGEWRAKYEAAAPYKRWGIIGGVTLLALLFLAAFLKISGFRIP